MVWRRKKVLTDLGPWVFDFVAHELNKLLFVVLVASLLLWGHKLTGVTYEDMASFGSQFEGPVHCGQEATVAGGWGSWSHHFHGPNAERNERLYPAHSLLYILAQGTVPPTVVASFHLNALGQDSPLQVRPVLPDYSRSYQTDCWD